VEHPPFPSVAGHLIAAGVWRPDLDVGRVLVEWRSAVDTPAERHPAGRGLMDSGLVVSVVRSAADIDLTILGDGHFIGITLDGNSCGALVCCSAQGAEALAVRLADGLERLRAARDSGK
jgi:hypothetical protein